MSETITPALRAYLTDWLAWAEAGAPEHDEFRPRFGLCTNARRRHRASADLRNALVADFGDEANHPFGGLVRYMSEAEAHHTNPLRLAWVRAKLAEKD
jgi:hypothetical protein